MASSPNVSSTSRPVRRGFQFARDALVPHLRRMGRAPRYIVFGVTPDGSINRPNIQALVQRYRQSLAYRLADPEPGDAVEGTLAAALARHVALYRYRRDLVAFEIVPSLKCLFLSDCYVRWAAYLSPIHFKRLAYLDGVQTPYGYGPWDFSNRTGEYYGSEIWTYSTGYDFTHGGYDKTTRLKGVVSRLVERLDGFMSLDSAYEGLPRVCFHWRMASPF